VSRKSRVYLAGHSGDKSTGKTRTFAVSIHATMTLDESVIAQGLADAGYIWLGKNPTEDEVLMHLAFNLVGKDLRLSQIDGYANCPDASARVDDREAEVEFEMMAPLPKRAVPKKPRRSNR
jgi:hypothetical protein